MIELQPERGLDQRQRRAFEQAREHKQIGVGKNPGRFGFARGRYAGHGGARSLWKCAIHIGFRHTRTEHGQFQIRIQTDQGTERGHEIFDPLVLAPSPGEQEPIGPAIVAVS